jgi:hypothetical protein
MSIAAGCSSTATHHKLRSTWPGQRDRRRPESGLQPRELARSLQRVPPRIRGSVARRNVSLVAAAAAVARRAVAVVLRLHVGDPRRPVRCWRCAAAHRRTRFGFAGHLPGGLLLVRASSGRARPAEPSDNLARYKFLKFNGSRSYRIHKAPRRK